MVENASGAPVPAGAMVNLHVFDQMQMVYTATTTLNEDGSYVFENVEVTPGRAFLSTVEYDGIVYGSEMVVAEGDKTQIELLIRVYETTSDTSALSVDRLHYLLELADEDTLRVVELYVISNASEQNRCGGRTGAAGVDFLSPTGGSEFAIARW